MFIFRTYLAIFIIALACNIPSAAEAKDLSALQTALALARDSMEKAKDTHDAKALAVKQQQLLVAERKKQFEDEKSQLDKMQTDTKQALEQYLNSKKSYDKAQANFDAAWGK